MLLPADIKENFVRFTRGLEKRGLKDAKLQLEKILDLDTQRKDIQQQMDEVLAESNQLSRKIGGLMKEGKKEEAEAIKGKTATLKDKSKQLGDQLQHVEGSLRDSLYNIPNIPNEDVPAGKSEEHNVEIRKGGKEVKLGENPKPQWELIEDFKLVDFELGNKVTGAGFPFYTGKGARLVRGMINYFLDQASEAGYHEVQPPVIINEDSGLGTGQLPDKEGQMYHIEDTNLYLIPTAEVPITNMYRNVILKDEELPIKKVGYTPCFRREAGSWGSHVRGLNRLHQFDKVEIVQISRPEDSYEVLKEMVSHVEKLVQSLDLPYRILKLCAGDLGFTSAITYDFEVYSAGQDKWLEVSSVSNFENYQSNRLMLRYKDDQGKKKLAHTLNGSALAVPRILAAILENNQEGNSIKIPEVLRSYVGFDSIAK